MCMVTVGVTVTSPSDYVCGLLGRPLCHNLESLFGLCWNRSDIPLKQSVVLVGGHCEVP
jgi:hypothetical protein